MYQIAIGFDWPRPLPPLIQYVGAQVSPSILSSTTAISPSLIDHMLKYATVQHKCTFVSMGTAITLSPSLVHAIVDTLSNQCVIWALPHDQVPPFSSSSFRAIVVRRRLIIHRMISVICCLAHCRHPSTSRHMYHKFVYYVVPKVAISQLIMIRFDYCLLFDSILTV
jgi:hypothetical protein